MNENRQAKSPDTKTVKLNADLHQTLKVYAAKKSNVYITDIINEAVKEYIQRNNIKAD